MSHDSRHGRPTIGVLAGWQFSWTATPLSYLDPIYRGACLAGHDLGCNVLLGCGIGSWTSPGSALRPAWPISSSDCDFVPIGPWNTNGLIAINPLHSKVRSRYLQDLAASGHPLVFVGSGENGPTVMADNHSGILEAIKHLVEHGRRHIAFIAGSPEDMAGDSGARLSAYYSAAAIHGLDIDARLVAWGQHVFHAGYAAMREILSSGASVDAVVASNDESALGAMQALRESGRRIPQDVAVIGFDDRPESAVQKPPLSSVRIPLLEMGYLAAESLFRFISGQVGIVESSMVATRLLPRESCGCGQSDAPLVASERKAAQVAMSDSDSGNADLVQAMASPILAEAQGLPADEIEILCQHLVDAFDASLNRKDRPSFLETLDAVLHEAAERGVDAHVWQTAITSLREAVDRWEGTWPQTAVHDLACELLDKARAGISAEMQRQYRQHVVDQRWTLNRLGTLTTLLLTALDEIQVYEVLSQHLPAMGIHTAWAALLRSDGDDPVARTDLRIISSKGQPPLSFRTRDFPPEELLPPDQPYSLALFPLGSPRGQLGFVAFDTEHLDLYGMIVQEMATSLNSAQLYREATEGRRLAEEANELKSRFLSTVSHELRTPMNLIVGLSGMLLQESAEGDTLLPERFLCDLEQINASGQYLGALIGDVLDLASSDAGKLHLTREFIDLSEALRVVAETGRQLAYKQGLQWNEELPESGPWVWGDRTRLRQVALNLVNNAVKFTARGGVSLRILAGSDLATVEVSDTGLGIPPEDQESIFDEFRRSERSVARGYGGLGLGLAICRRLVEMHGGTIGVQSSGEEGAGSTFGFSLPIVESPAVQVQRRAISPPSRESALILTSRVESCSRLCDFLSKQGLEVNVALIHEVTDWQSRLQVSPPGAIVVDASVLPPQGWEVLKAIKSHPQTRHLPVLLCSMAQDSGSVLEFDYLTKPFELAELTRALDQHWLVPEAQAGFRTVLVVDDEMDTLEMHVRMVQAHSPSHRVLRARGGLEAIDMLRREQVDLVLLDLMMPEVDGFDVLEAMGKAEATRRIPVIVLTGKVLTGIDMTRLSQGVATVLSKDLFSIEETLARIDSALERSRELSGQAQRLVRQAMAYIHTHYAQPVSRRDLAQHVALSHDYLTFCFRKELGVTPIAYLNRYRVNQARELLTGTDKSITEIALKVGFSDSSYFSRVFRREVGVSPEAYRQA